MKNSGGIFDMFGLALIAPFLNVKHDVFCVKVRENGGAREVGEVTERRNNSAQMRTGNARNGVNIPRKRSNANYAKKLALYATTTPPRRVSETRRTSMQPRRAAR